MRAAPFEDRTEPVDCARVQCSEPATVVLDGLNVGPAVALSLWLVAAVVVVVTGTMLHRRGLL